MPLLFILACHFLLEQCSAVTCGHMCWKSDTAVMFRQTWGHGGYLADSSLSLSLLSFFSPEQEFFWMAVTQTCKALIFVPVRENFDRAKVTEQLRDLRSLTAITQPRVLGFFFFFLQVSTKLSVQLYLIVATEKLPSYPLRLSSVYYWLIFVMKSEVNLLCKPPKCPHVSGILMPLYG